MQRGVLQCLCSASHPRTADPVAKKRSGVGFDVGNVPPTPLVIPPLCQAESSPWGGGVMK